MKLPFRVPPPGASFDVVGIGANSVDFLAVVDAFPSSDAKQHLRRFEVQSGGQIATAVVACARLGCRARYIGTFGGDDFGRLARESLLVEGVDIDHCRTASGLANQRAIVLVEELTGRRTVLWDRPQDLRLDPASLSEKAVLAGRLLMTDCEELPAASAAAKQARSAGIPTMVDVEEPRQGVEDLLRHIDVIVAAARFPEAFTGRTTTGSALEALQRQFATPLVCVTLGEDGSLARCGGREIRTPAFPVRCVDSTGAGDAFRGGLAAACLRHPDEDLEWMLRYASAVAALNCRGLGARAALPTEKAVEQLLYARSEP